MASAHKPAKTRATGMFPDPESTGPDGVLAYSESLTVEMLVEAYSRGIFPWPVDAESPIFWFSPVERGVLDFKDLHIPTSFRKFIRKTSFELRIDTAFQAVITACAEQPRPGQDGTWITADMTRTYTDLHLRGYAHSIEAWDGGALAGGLYGVYVNSVFSGESMFHQRTGASKFCLYHTARLLQSTGHRWMDIQMVTPLLESWGGRLIPRSDYLKRLAAARKAKLTNPFRRSQCA